MACPLSLIEICEMVNARCMLFYSAAINFNIDVLIEPDKPHVAVTAENGHNRHVAGTFQPPLEALVDSRGMSGVGAVAGMAVEMRQQTMPKLFQFNQQG